MFRPKRPLAGPLILLAVASALALSNLACAKKEVADTWQMQPPKLEMRDSGGARLQLRASEIMKSTTAMSSLIGDEVAFLQFASEDRGLAMSVQSQCRSADGQEAAFTDASKTAEEVALISLLPTQTLTPDGLRKDWLCNFKLRVTNGAGSQQSFSFNALKFNFALSKIQPIVMNAQADASRPRDGVRRRLICSTWWTDSSDADLDVMAHAEKVNGVDTRKIERQPNCSVIELQSKAKLAGLFRPVFAAPHNTWNREVLIANNYVENLFHQPLLAWNIRNDDSSPQIYFIATKSSRVQTSALYLKDASEQRYWTKPTRVLPRLSVTNAIEAKETAEGLYFRVAAGATARVTISSSREEHFVSTFDFSHFYFKMLITTDQPVSLQTISGFGPATNLASLLPATLDSAVRDEGKDRDILLSNILLTRESNTGFLVEQNSSMLEALRMGLTEPFSGCRNKYDASQVCPE